MSFLKKIQERIIPIQTPGSVSLFQQDEAIRHEFVDFGSAYRIGILGAYYDAESQDIIDAYKKHLDRLGYESEVLMFVNKKEKDHQVFLPNFGWDDLERKSMLPHSPRTDRVMRKRYDLLLNLYLQPCPQLFFISQMSYARCRVAPFLEAFKPIADVFIPIKPDDTLQKLIEQLNLTLTLKPYERKPV